MKATNLPQFHTSIDQFNVHVRTVASQMVRRVAFAVDKAVVMASPVDTGRFRANWQVTVGAPATGTVKHVPGMKGSTAGVNAAKAMEQIMPLMQTYQLGQPIYIVNNLVYGPRLNDGHSKQAPENFVQKAIRAGVAEANR